MDLDLKDRVYIVTDGASPIGWQTVRRLLSEGARVVIGTPSSRADMVRNLVQDEFGTTDAAGAPISATVGIDNITDPTQVQQTVTALAGMALQTWGRLDGALVEAGNTRELHQVMDTTDERWTAAFAADFVVPLLMLKTLAGRLSDGGSLALVLSNDIHGVEGVPMVSGALDRGLATVLLALSEELGPRGIRVNGLLAGLVGHDLEDAREPTADPVDPTDPLLGGSEDHQALVDRSGLVPMVPLGRLGEPDEFARVAAFVLSPSASYISGTLIPVDGGLSRSG